MSYAVSVGARLRSIRLQKGLSLQEVERRSGGAWKAAVIGSYERGDRNISAARMCELAEFYGVAPTEVLPADDVPSTGDLGSGIAVDLQALAQVPGDRWLGLRRFLESVQVQRGDFNRQVLTVRSEDLRALAVVAGTSPDELAGELRAAGCLAS